MEPSRQTFGPWRSYVRSMKHDGFHCERADCFPLKSDAYETLLTRVVPTCSCFGHRWFLIIWEHPSGDWATCSSWYVSAFVMLLLLSLLGTDQGTNTLHSSDLLRLSNNRFSGSIPSELGLLSALLSGKRMCSLAAFFNIHCALFRKLAQHRHISSLHQYS